MQAVNKYFLNSDFFFIFMFVKFALEMQNLKFI